MRLPSTTDATPPPQPGARPWAALAMWAVALAAFASALVFARSIANPMVMADNWLFVDTFLRHALDGGATFGDFLVKRAGLDHGLPHYKLLMLLNAKFLGLDFSYEAMLGVVFALLGWVVLYRIAASDTPRADRGAGFHLVLAAVAAVYMSLNAFYIYLYSMVTLSYLSFLIAFLVFHFAWRALRGGSRWPFLALAVAYAVCADTSSLVTGIALAMALVLAAWHLGAWRRAAELVGLLVLAIVVGQLAYAQFGEIRGSTLAEFNVPLGERLDALAVQWREAWRWVVAPLASGVAGKEPLRHFFGHWLRAQAGLGLVMLVAHAWFWWSALRHPPRAASFAAVCIMLLFYGYVAGLLYGRVFLRGSDYLDQARYVTLYQLGVVALLMMGVSRLQAVAGRWRGTRVLAAASVLLVLLQVPLALHSWSRAPGIHGYYHAMARQYGAVLREPAPRRACVDQLTLCQLPPEVRIRVLEMLREHRLNLYSPAFQARHPELAEAAGPIPPAP